MPKIPVRKYILEDHELYRSDQIAIERILPYYFTEIEYAAVKKKHMIEKFNNLLKKWQIVMLPSEDIEKLFDKVDYHIMQLRLQGHIKRNSFKIKLWMMQLYYDYKVLLITNNYLKDKAIMKRMKFWLHICTYSINIVKNQRNITAKTYEEVLQQKDILYNAMEIIEKLNYKNIHE